MTTTALAPVSGVAQALPTGGSVAHGDVAIGTPSATQMTINQRSNSAVVNWNSFSIGQGARVDIQQPSANSALLNRVTGNTTSQIHGQLNANGQVHLVNPNGVFIGPNGTVSAGGFVASTLDISDEDFVNRRLRYSGNGSSAAVENAGRISILPGGYAALLGGRVSNSGSITVPMGRVGFAAGERVTLDISGDQFLQVALPSEGADEMEALIENSGSVSADGGLIEMRAAVARNAARRAINLSGVAEARSVSGRSGSIVLGGSGGKVRVSGRVRTKPRRTVVVEQSLRPMLRGGDITITGREVELAGATIDASGSNGLIRIGGDFAGQGDLPRAERVTGDAATRILADGHATGNGGRVVLWSDIYTSFEGNISARGGSVSGDGGFVEISSAKDLRYRGLTDLRATDGAFGTLLLDPENITVPGSDDEATIEAALALGNFVLDTSRNEFEEAGDITINVDIDWTAATRFSLLADSNVILNGAINGSNGELFINAGGTITTGTGGTVDVSTFRLAGGEWTQLGTLPSFSAQSFSFDTISSSFLRATGGNGDIDTPFLLTDVFGLQGVGSSRFSGNSFALVNDIDASGTTGWTNLGFGNTGFNPISGFTGTLDGRRFTVSNLFQNGAGIEGNLSVGMFSTLNAGATVSNLNVANANISGSNAGIIAASNAGTIDGVSVSGTVTASPDSLFTSVAAGGIVATNTGTVTESFSTANVVVNVGAMDAAATAAAGGLVGVNATGGVVNEAHATGTVTINNDRNVGATTLLAGGFVGRDNGQIDNAYATGNVAVNSTVTVATTGVAGGFVAEHQGEIDSSYSIGTPTVTGAATAITGGFAGRFDPDLGFSFDPTLSTNFWDTTTSGLTNSAGGVGITTAQFQNTATFLGLAPSPDWNFTTNWAPGDTGFYPELYATSPVVYGVPNGFTVTYGQTPTATTTGTVNGGPTAYRFGPVGDTLDTSGLFNSLNFANQNVGTRPFTLATANLLSSNSQSYRVVDAPTNATIVPAPLTITADNATAVYGAGTVFAGTEFTTSGLQFSDTVTSVTLASTGASVTADVAGSPYAIVASDPVGTGLSNYTITFVDGVLNVTPAPLTITANDASRPYGSGTVFGGTEFVATGLLNADTVTSVTLTSAGTPVTATVAGSPYAIVASDPVGTGLGNYTITFVDGALTVNPAPLTITADNASKVYGATLGFAGTEFSVSGLLNSDTVTTVTLASAGAPATASVAGSPFAITASDPVGTGLSNYTVTFVDGALTVTPAPLTITSNDASKVYGTTQAFAGTEFTTSGLLNSDTVTSISLASAGAPATASVDGSPYAITGSNAVGTGLSNYTVTFVDGALTVTPAALTITADNASKVYGSTLAFAGTEFTTSGLVNGDTVTSISLASAGAPATASVAGSPYAIAGSNAVGSGLSNYTVSFVDGALTVTPAPLTITADNASKAYGTTFTFAGTEFSVSGLLNNDSVTSVTLASAGAPATATVDGSPYAITGSDAVGTGISNYSITFVDGALTVTPAALTITATDASKVYGTEFTFAGTEFTASGLLNSDSVTTVELASAGAPATATVTGSPYAISAGDAAGSGLGNYTITFVDGALTVTPASLTITANDQVKAAGTEFTFAGTEFTTSGLLNSDTVTSAALFSEGASIDATIEGSPYAIGIDGVSGSGLENYVISIVDGTFVVTNPETQTPPPPAPPPVVQPNPPDAVVLTSNETGSGGAGGVLSSTESGTTVTSGTPSSASATETLTEVRSVAVSLEAAATACGESGASTTRYLACLSDALNDFANELDAISTDLPPGLENVAQIVQTARVRVDQASARAARRLASASTDAERAAIQAEAIGEARAAIQEAGAEIRKSIALVRADDPELANLQTATIVTIAAAVESVDIGLSRVTDL